MASRIHRCDHHLLLGNASHSRELTHDKRALGVGRRAVLADRARLAFIDELHEACAFLEHELQLANVVGIEVGT